MKYQYLVVWSLFITTGLTGCASTTSEYAVHSQTAVDIELVGYNGLTERSIFKGEIDADSKHQFVTNYHGLALLSFAGGQSYPVILSNDPFTLNITDPSQPPTFADNAANKHLYKSLSGDAPVPNQYTFTHLMIQAKELLESTHSVKTTEELTAKKKEYHQFVSVHYESLKHSDMITRLMAQYFMMHEYVNYHVEGAPATAIKEKYQEEVVNGVGSWIETLKPYLPEQEVLNYCLSLYYNRSMVTLASVIVDNFEDAAFCSGEEKDTFSFPNDLTLTDGRSERKLADIKSDKVLAFVSEDCPVSMIKTVIKARLLARQKATVRLIVTPLEKLSESHLAMGRMISGGNLLFIDDDQWRKDNLHLKPKLPLFVEVSDRSENM